MDSSGQRRPRQSISRRLRRHAVQYLTVAKRRDARSRRHRASPEVQTGRVWRAEAGGGDGFLHLRPRDRQAPLHRLRGCVDPRGRVRHVDILQYRKSYGGEVRSPSWLAQFVGKTSRSPLQVGNDIRNISGATLSSMHVTEGVKRIWRRMDTCDSVRRDSGRIRTTSGKNIAQHAFSTGSRVVVRR